MQAVRNRVIEGMQDWLKREENMACLFSPNTLRTRYFQQIKLDYLRELQGQVLKDAAKDERMTLRILKGEMRDIERWLYKHPLERLLRRLGRTLKKLLSRGPKIVIAERTSWMMQSTNNARKSKKDDVQEKAIRPVQAYKQKVSNPVLLEKKRITNKRGLKM